MRDATRLLDCRRFGEDQTCSTRRKPPQMNKVSGIKISTVRTILTHRGDNDPIWERDTAHFKGLKKFDLVSH